jgi:hypothetical protein
MNLAKYTSEDAEFRVFCKQAFVFQGHFDAVDCVYNDPHSLADDASVDSDVCESDSDSVDDCDDEHNDVDDDESD